MCILEADEPGGRVIQPPSRRPDCGEDPVDVRGAVVVLVYVRVVAKDDLAAPDVTVHEDGDDVAHGPRRDEERGLLPMIAAISSWKRRAVRVRASHGRRRQPPLDGMSS